MHVKLDGPLQARIRRAAQEHNIPEERAKKRQRLEDEFRSELSQKMYNFDPRDNGWYDIVINGAELSTEDAVLVLHMSQLETVPETMRHLLTKLTQEGKEDYL